MIGKSSRNPQAAAAFTAFGCRAPVSERGPDRYFGGTVMGGRPRVRGLPDWGTWDPARLEWNSEPMAELLLNTTEGGRKVRTREELEAGMKEPIKVAPRRTVWIRESLARGLNCNAWPMFGSSIS